MIRRDNPLGVYEPFPIKTVREANEALDQADRFPPAQRNKILRAVAKFMPLSAMKALRAPKSRRNPTGLGAR